MCACTCTNRVTECLIMAFLKKKINEALCSMQLSVLSHHCYEKEIKNNNNRKNCKRKRHPKITLGQLDSNWVTDKHQQCP